MDNYQKSSQNNQFNSEEKLNLENSLGQKKPLAIISSLNNNYISPKFLSPIAQRSLNSFGNFPFAHSNITSIRSLC